MVNSFGINVDVIKYFCCISIITQPLKCCQPYTESFENQIWMVCSEITTIAFWHGEITFSIATAYPQGAEEPMGLCPDPGLGARKREPSGRLRVSRSHPDSDIFLPWENKGRRSIPLGCFNLTCSTAAKKQQSHTFRPLRRFPFFLSLLWFPEALSCFQNWVLWFYSLWYVVSVQTKTPERTYIYNLLSLETAKEYAIHQSRPKGTDILTSLMTV